MKHKWSKKATLMNVQEGENGDNMDEGRDWETRLRMEMVIVQK
jgi:hypothetical protein